MEMHLNRGGHGGFHTVKFPKCSDPEETWYDRAQAQVFFGSKVFLAVDVLESCSDAQVYFGGHASLELLK